MLCAAMGGSVSMPVLAAQIREDDRKGSVSVELDDVGTDRNNVELWCYQVGITDGSGQSEISWKLTEDFSDSKVDLNHMAGADDQRKAADRLKIYIDSHKEIQELQKGLTDSGGKVVFNELEQGVYLIIQKSGFSVYGSIFPFLVFIPSPDAEGKDLLYDMEVQTKGEKPASSDEPDRPGDISGSSVTRNGSVRTGDDTPLGIFLTLAVVSACFAGLILWKMFMKKKNL